MLFLLPEKGEKGREKKQPFRRKEETARIGREKRKEGGREKMAEEKRKCRISVIVTEEEKKEIEKKAKEAGLSISSYMKACGLKKRISIVEMRSAEPVLKAAGSSIMATRKMGTMLKEFAGRAALTHDDVQEIERLSEEIREKADEVHEAVAGTVFRRTV